MHFLYPAFLFALASLAIPVIVHLFNFRRYQKVYFSNVQFLKNIQEQQSSRRNIKERLILAARLLALFFLVLAFSRPYIPGKRAGINGARQVVSVFIDNSYSMQNLNREGSLLDEAKRRAKEIAAAYTNNDRFQLLTQDFEGRHQRLLTPAEFVDEVDAVKISPRNHTLQQIIYRQQGLLDNQPEVHRSVYILSDFQKNISDGKPLKVDTGLHVSLVQLRASTPANVAVDSVWLLSAIHRPGETEKMIVKLHNYSNEESTKIPLKLTINGEQKALGGFSIPAKSSQIDTLTFSGLSAGWQRGEISLQDNPITFDNRFFLSFNVKEKMQVLLIDGGIPNPYLKAVFATDPFFDARRVSDGNVDYASLGTYPLIVLSDVRMVSPGLAQQLTAYVKKGGTLAVFPATDADLNNNRTFLQNIGAAYPKQVAEENLKVASLNLQNPVFKDIFESLPKNPELPTVKKYYQLKSAVKAQNENLMQLQNGNSFWAGFNSGAGKVYVSAVPLADDFSNLPRHALFVPIMFRIALLSGREQPLFYNMGHDDVIETLPIQTSEKQLLKLTKSGKSIIPDVRQQEGSTLLYVSDQLQETGLYDLKKQDSTVAVMAFNDNRAESDMSYYTAGELNNIVPEAKGVIETTKASLKDVIGTSNFGTQLWKLCIILALVFLAAEILLIRFYKTDQRVLLSADEPAPIHT
ncbi:BatA domain-containing protein [Mucilaginibacter auburnensis]|uniref:Putative membrane protein (TIGR02226 family) n=1 Tax=Mucilaginibacter auburnensis TaxID=1457233 RepID=A0A2H9VLV4_9SPHI|nr:BatA domain-containing protein [Mucilaginibacter auburnensis]PJJ79292.1 putative membrane protein (TIGR02226 family) [Mucilaginibacter auburnensis]